MSLNILCRSFKSLSAVSCCRATHNTLSLVNELWVDEAGRSVATVNSSKKILAHLVQRLLLDKTQGHLSR